MADFPTNLKPSVNRGYTFSGGENIISQQVQGGVPLQMIGYKYSPIPFDVSIVLNPLTLQVFQDWFYSKINGGADKFNMNLDSGNGIEPHIVHINQESMTFDGTQAPIYSVGFQVVAEKTPAQDKPFNGELTDLYELYGSDLNALLAALENFTLNELP